MIWNYNISKHYLKNLSIKSNAIKIWRFGDDISPLSNANKKHQDLEENVKIWKTKEWNNLVYYIKLV